MKHNILIVDDSALMRRVLSDAVNSDERFEVGAVAINGQEGLKILLENPTFYDVVLLDIYMPKMTGLELLIELESHQEVTSKVIICSTRADESAEETITALDHGAFDFIKKPENLINAKSNIFREELLKVLEVATTAKSTTNVEKPISITKPKVRAVDYNIDVTEVRKKRKLVAIACSTGGPKTLQSIIPYLPKELNASVLIVQHMPKGFTHSLAARLDDVSQISVKEASNGEVLQKGMVYIAQGGRHMRLVKSGRENYKIAITDDPPRDALKPCANIMYEDLAKSFYDEIVCVVLTGMGSDGTEGIKSLAIHNKVYVIAQDEASSVVYGMPKMVAQAGLVDEIVPLKEIANIIIRKVGVQ
ncbi:MAG: chemotaxis-specific protein-glutamate methyltransferase CheB [Clostridiales bacterium]|nr:chemotaxis-specific protein-glutamate methyltransferase CheB [Clostridiales bacterium]